mmetsp:Transcript_61364/g.145100  ORF Transcript_61364/g.145100 Transcript_61364/m.145100 type:complete len:224 (+) Transcript_61364:946-1617(+)
MQPRSWKAFGLRLRVTLASTPVCILRCKTSRAWVRVDMLSTQSPRTSWKTTSPPYRKWRPLSRLRKRLKPRASNSTLSLKLHWRMCSRRREAIFVPTSALTRDRSELEETELCRNPVGFPKSLSRLLWVTSPDVKLPSPRACSLTATGRRPRPTGRSSVDVRRVPCVSSAVSPWPQWSPSAATSRSVRRASKTTRKSSCAPSVPSRSGRTWYSTSRTSRRSRL